jgi:glycosyltransferase involved in cell wall biosynthesis
MAPLVSVILPVRNGAGTLDAALHSLMQQTLSDFEVLVVDDGSTDATKAHLQRWAARDRRIRHWTTPPCGLVAALEFGRTQAQAAWLARMDADDESFPKRFELSLDALANDPSLSGVGTGVEISRADQPPSPALVQYGRWLSSLTTAEKLFLDRFVESPLCHPTVMLKRSALDQVGGWQDGDFPEDWHLWLRLLEAGHRLRCIDSIQHRWNDHDHRLTRTDVRYARRKHLNLKALFLARQRPSAPFAIWGAGETGVALGRALMKQGCQVTRFIDVNPRKIGQRIHGAAVVWPDDLSKPGTEHILAAVGAKGARAEIRAYLDSRGHVEPQHFTCVA